jgi:hypothetical protein
MEICDVWNRLRSDAHKAKERYINAAKEAGKYYAGPNHDFVYAGEGAMEPDYKVTINKVYELVSIFGPMVYARDPKRWVEARRNGQAEIAACLNGYLGYTPGEFGLKYNAKEAIDESLINGRGCLMTGRDKRSGMVITRKEATKNIYFDPSEDLWYNGHFLMRLRRKPMWKIADLFGRGVAKRLLNEGAATREDEEPESQHMQGFERLNSEYQDKLKLEAWDAPQVTYIEVYSKMGLGLRIKKSLSEATQLGAESPDNLLLVYQPNSKIVMHIGNWPIPYWADHGKNSWPVSCLDPAENQDKTWPISLITPALGEQKFLDWGWSFALSAVRVASRSITVFDSQTDDKLVAALRDTSSHIGVPLDVTGGRKISDLIHHIPMPQLNQALVEMLAAVEILFEKATGLYEVLYGQSARQYRSATEAQVKAEFSRLRIDDVIDRAEDWMSDVARKEAIGARWLLSGGDIAPIVGPELAQAWDVYRPGNLQQMMREYDYTIGAGSMRKRTPQYRAEVAEMRLNRLLPLAASIGDLDTVNRMLAEWEDANGNPHPERFALTAVPPPEAMGQSGQQPQQPQEPVAPEVMSVEDGQAVMGTPEVAG